jgi:fluoride exporter
MSPLTWVLFVVAGAVGASVRYLVDVAVTERTGGLFPWGTMVVNVSGSLVLGLLTGLALYHGFPEAPRLVLGTGFCGAYTTFSTHTFETVRLIEDGALAAAARNAAATLLATTAAAALGLLLAAAV